MAQPILGAMMGPLGAGPLVLASALSGGTILSFVPSPLAAQAFLALGGLIAFDMLLGTAKGLWFDREGFSSTKFGKGAVKSAFVMFVPLAFWVLARVDPILTTPLHWLSSFSLVYFSCWEVASILKNAGQCGLPVPQSWVDTLTGTMKQAGKAPRKVNYAPQDSIRRSSGRLESEAFGEAEAQAGDSEGPGPRTS